MYVYMCVMLVHVFVYKHVLRCHQHDTNTPTSTPCRDTAPHMLTAMRDADANNERMARLTVALRLHVHLQHESPIIFNDITTFAAAMDTALHEHCQALTAPLLKRLADAKAALAAGSMSAEALPGMIDGLIQEAAAMVGASVPHAEQVKTRLLAWCTDGAPAVLTIAAQDALELLMEPLALRLATAPTFGSAQATAPKVLGDILESLLGGVFLDCGACFVICRATR